MIILFEVQIQTEIISFLIITMLLKIQNHSLMHEMLSRLHTKINLLGSLIFPPSFLPLLSPYLQAYGSYLGSVINKIRMISKIYEYL